MLLPLVCVAFAGLSNALSVKQPLYPRQNMSTPLKSASIPSGAISGVATFVIFPHQTSTVCGPFSGTSLAASVPTTERGDPPSPEYQATYAKTGDNGAFGAAAGSISPGFGPGGRCSGSIDMNVCDGEVPISSYVPPGCEQNRCGQCYEVTNKGGLGGEASGAGQSITVQIIDACPAENAYNFCKTSIDAKQKCMDPGTNSLDIDQNAYTALTGRPYASGVTPNLNIGITPVTCP